MHLVNLNDALFYIVQVFCFGFSMKFYNILVDFPRSFMCSIDSFFSWFCEIVRKFLEQIYSFLENDCVCFNGALKHYNHFVWYSLNFYNYTYMSFYKILLKKSLWTGDCFLRFLQCTTSLWECVCVSANFKAFFFAFRDL